MCDCIEKYKQDLALIKKLAKKLTKLIKSDVRIYTKQLLPVPVYDFEPVLVKDHANTEICIINYEFNQK
jgi:hypothetical protein